MDADVKAFWPTATELQWTMLFVVIEHVFLGVRVAIDRLIPDQTGEVKAAIDRDDFILMNRRNK